MNEWVKCSTWEFPNKMKEKETDRQTDGQTETETETQRKRERYIIFFPMTRTRLTRCFRGGWCIITLCLWSRSFPQLSQRSSTTAKDGHSTNRLLEWLCLLWREKYEQRTCHMHYNGWLSKWLCVQHRTSHGSFSLVLTSHDHHSKFGQKSLAALRNSSRQSVDTQTDRQILWFKCNPPPPHPPHPTLFLGRGARRGGKGGGGGMKKRKSLRKKAGNKRHNHSQKEVTREALVTAASWALPLVMMSVSHWGLVVSTNLFWGAVPWGPR